MFDATAAATQSTHTFQSVNQIRYLIKANVM